MPTWMLVFWAFVLTAIGLIGGADQTQDPEGEQTRLLIEGTTEVRSAYWAYTRSRAYGAVELIATRQAAMTMARLARETNSPQAWRRLALTRFMLEAGDWRSALLTLRTASPPRPLAEVDRELALWRVVLEKPRYRWPYDSRRRDTVVNEARSFVEPLDLGWFRYAALAALYENSGSERVGERYRDLALRSTDRLTIAALIVVLVGLGGLGIWFTLLFGRLVLGRSAIRLHMSSFDPLSADHARSLTLAAAAYFAGMVLVRMLPGLLPQAALERLASDAGLRSAVTAVAVALSLVPPLLVLRATGFIVSPGRAGIGLVRLRPARDLAAGLLGHASLLPLLAITLIISSQLFEPSASRVNPAIEEFASGSSVLSRFILLIAGAVLAPIVEEVAFRGILMRALQAQLGTIWAILISSAVFAILHPQLPMGFLSIFALGAGFAVLYRVTGSLWPAIIAHAVNNTLVFVYLALMLAD